MAKIEIKMLEDMKKILDKVPPNKIVFWIGAGIDSGQPTCLPLGNGLTDFVLQLTTGNNASKLIKTWENNYRLIKSVVDEELEISERPRLETIIEAVREFEEHQKKKESVIEGLNSFSSKEFHYNNEHYLLARYLHRGANIVTTNYGDFISKAYEDEYGIGKIVHEYKDIHLYKALNKWSSCIYHIHGISSDLKTIGANLTTVKNSLPSSFKKIFMNWLEMGCVFIFMGYSGLDSLDVNPFLQTFCNEKNTTGIYVRHTTEKKIRPVSEKEKVLLYAFEEKVVCPCLTSDFFSTLLDFERIEKIVSIEYKSDWKEIFEKYAIRYSKDYSDAFISGLCYRLGISITKTLGTKRWLKDVTRSDNIDLWYKNYYSFANAVITGQQRIVKRQGRQLLKNDDELMKNDYETARGNLVNAVVSPDKDILKYIKSKLDLNQLIDWSVSTKLNRYVEHAFFEELKDIVVYSRKKRPNKPRDTIRITMKSLELMIERGYNCIIDVHQMATAYRTLAICQRLVGLSIEDSISNIDIALHIYADVSSINGVAVTILYKAAVLLLDYNENGNVGSLEDAENILKMAQKLIFECGLKKYYKRFVFVYIFCIFVKMGKKR